MNLSPIFGKFATLLRSLEQNLEMEYLDQVQFSLWANDWDVRCNHATTQCKEAEFCGNNPVETSYLRYIEEHNLPDLTRTDYQKRRIQELFG
jgi:hypothetical protein